ncbi:hypothetical protein HPB50_012689 [Hyalomma asiaticum]|uniref:Uncharacterized protein n=1 Tax=Hyalomma asiaticum TaxID=266040 RepID=A0ACB7SGX2_HYAAI|nr:hypothetical protein HPB50_012689 [Hyalomma asiaticum]
MTQDPLVLLAHLTALHHVGDVLVQSRLLSLGRGRHLGSFPQQDDLLAATAGPWTGDFLELPPWNPTICTPSAGLAQLPCGCRPASHAHLLPALPSPPTTGLDLDWLSVIMNIWRALQDMRAPA